MRIADKMNYDQVNNNLGRNRQEIAELQNQAASQKRVTKPSDDPLAAARVLGTRTEINGNQQFLKSIANARAFLEYSDQSLNELSDVLVRAKELAISQANDASSGPNTREMTAAEVAQLHSQAVQVGNRKLGDRFLFAGFKTTRPPFDPDGKYSGDDGEMEIIINKEAKVAMNIPGSRVFLGQEKKAAAAADPGSTQFSTQLDLAAKDPGSSTKDPDDRQPANVRQVADLSTAWRTPGINVFSVLKTLEIGMRTNDKASIQTSLDSLDEALAQVILSRAQLGARVSTLNSATDTLQKGSIDAKTMAASLEDADTFELVSDLNKSESTLKATLATSGKLIQPSLLDFLR